MDAFFRWLKEVGDALQRFSERTGGPPVSPTAPTQPGPWDDEDDGDGPIGDRDDWGVSPFV